MEIVEFNGELSVEAKKELIRGYQKMTTWCVAFAVAFVLAFLIPFCIYEVPECLPLTFIVFLFIPLNYFAKPKRKALENILTKSVQITENSVITESMSGYNEVSLEDVKKVVDFGEFYKIIFCFPKKTYDCICQKNLVTKGSIEDFEEIFSELIVRKNIK